MALEMNPPNAGLAPAEPGSGAGPRSRWVVSGLVLVALVGALVTYKTSGSLATIAKVEQAHTLKPKSEAIATAALPDAVRPLARAANYLAIVWPALVFGVLIGAAVRALVPVSWLTGLLGGPPARAQLLGGLAGAPLMLCSCCVAPVFAAVHDRTRRLGPASALMFAAPSLNPAALTLTFMLFTPAIALTRLSMALLLVFGVSAVVARWLGPAVPGSATQCSLETSREARPADAFGAFGREVGRLATQTVPLIVLGVVASSLLLELLPVERLAETPARIVLVLLMALVGVPLALPTFAEIPLALGLLAAGVPAGAAVALLIAGPAINLPSLFTLRRLTGTRYALALGSGTFLVAVLGGLLV